ncbi:hypothetical protein NHX12_029790, partial [Muraenolepis orangiensis]
FLSEPGSGSQGPTAPSLCTVSPASLAAHPLGAFRVLQNKAVPDHITRDKLEKVLAMLQGANQKALLMYSNVDMRSQEAYEMAVRGALGPDGKSAPILTGLRVKSFQPPHFTLELQCLNETQRYLRKVVHEIGLELRSTASCTAVRRTRDGGFTLDHALTRRQWTAADVALVVQRDHASKIRRNGRLPAAQSRYLSVQPSIDSDSESSEDIRSHTDLR